MSYGLTTKCGDCQKVGRCTDRHMIQNAINCIHSMPYNPEAGHLGWGTVNLDCQGHVAKTEEPK